MFCNWCGIFESRRTVQRHNLQYRLDNRFESITDSDVFIPSSDLVDSLAASSSQPIALTSDLESSCGNSSHEEIDSDNEELAPTSLTNNIDEYFVQENEYDDFDSLDEIESGKNFRVEKELSISLFLFGHNTDSFQSGLEHLSDITKLKLRLVRWKLHNARVSNLAFNDLKSNCFPEIPTWHVTSKILETLCPEIKAQVYTCCPKMCWTATMTDDEHILVCPYCSTEL